MEGTPPQPSRLNWPGESSSDEHPSVDSLVWPQAATIDAYVPRASDAVYEMSEDEAVDELDDDELVEFYYQRYLRRDEMLRRAGKVALMLAALALICLGIRLSGLVGGKSHHVSGSACARLAARQGDGEARMVRMDCGSGRVKASHPVTPVGTHSWAIPSRLAQGHGTSFVVWNGTAHPVRRGVVNARYKTLVMHVDEAVPGVPALRQLPRRGDAFTAIGLPLRFAGLREDSLFGPGVQVLLLAGQSSADEVGAPVIDRRGRLAGMIYAFSQKPPAALAIPASVLAADAAKSEAS
jgi:hypothetical protein